MDPHIQGVPVQGVGTKGLVCDDPLAKLIQEEFIYRVDPHKLVLFLPHGLLTETEEDRVIIAQNSRCREDAANLLLNLLTLHHGWVSGLQQGLRHREIRLEDLADKIDDLQRIVPMEVDLTGDHMVPMEVDADLDLTAPMEELLAGRRPVELNEQQVSLYSKLVLAQIAEEFFTTGRSVQDTQLLADQYVRISNIIIPEYAFGCLELRLRLRTSHDLKELERMMDGGVLYQVVERILLREERRNWLVAKAASYGLKWQPEKLKITIRKEDLDRCEVFLKVTEEMASPRTPAETLLLKVVTSMGKGRPTKHNTQNLPKLLLSFLDWLLQEHPDLAEKVSLILAASPLDISITETMATCRQFFGLSNEFEKDLAKVAFEMLRDIQYEGIGSSETSSGSQMKEESSRLYVEAPPESPLAQIVTRLIDAKLMVSCQIPDKNNTFSFSSPFVMDFAFSCTADLTETPLTGYVSRALKFGSSFAVLHFIDFLLNLSLSLEQLASGLRASEEFGRIHKKQSQMIDRMLMGGAQELLHSVSNDNHSRDVVEMYMACYNFITFPNIGELFKRQWTIFGPEWKNLARDMLSLGRSDALPDILLVSLSDGEMDCVVETAEMVLSAKRSVDLSGKLSNLNERQLRVILACVQLTDISNFKLVNVNGTAALRVTSTAQGNVTSTVSQPALKLCENILEDLHVRCLLDALAGMQSITYFDFTSCTVGRANLQLLLDCLHMKSVQALVLNGITFSDLKGRWLPRFSHLKRLQTVDLGRLGLQDEQMQELAQQLCMLSDLRELTLEENPITTEGLSQLTSALASRKSLRVLRLPHCQLDAGAAFVLGALLTSARNLHVLNLSHCHLMDSGLQHLSVILKEHTRLSKVSLRGGEYTPPGLASFLTHLAKCDRMQHLEIGQCPLEEDGLDVSDKLLKALSKSSYWDALGLWQCRIGYTTFLERLDTFDIQLRGLTTLVLQDNHLDDLKITHLADAVRRGTFRYLKHLNLRQNNVGKTGAESLAEVLPLLPLLTELLLQHSNIPASAALPLSRAALRLPNMKVLDLSDSFGMGYYDVIEVISEIERIVREENVTVGDGVSFAENDSQMELQFITEKLRLLDTKHEMMTERPAQETAEEERRVPPLPMPPSSARPPTADPAILTEEKPAASVEGAVGVIDARQREMTESYGDSIVIDGMLHINLAHT